MGHGLGVVESLSIPEPVVVFFALVTLLGGLPFYLLGLTAAYALGELVDGVTRERAAFVVAVALGALALTAGLKELLVHPRPPGAGVAPELAWLPTALVPLWERAATADGFTLPSGHATGSAAVYGAAALAFEVGRRRVRYAAAALVVVAVALSRVVIGVHYLTDVLVGVALGGGYLAVVWTLSGGERLRVKRALSLALLVAVLGAAFSFSFETITALGGALGGRLGWTLFGGRAPDPTRRTGAVAAVLAVVVAGGLVAASVAGEAPVVGFLAAGVAVVAVFAAPLAAARLVGRARKKGA
ncbi:phosphatase PAP2 family protein [Halosegnis marinus]|uniref:Phosphatase PAP2 family protein n=1 Tax=Halosegnis marinus TaxID=3034023 RepID=A0ABD5ZP54_9EURY|nr:phosphatase PAP2 family protein [Halosegnis sp. DT85]